MDILDFFELEPAGGSLEELETPVPVIDIDVVDRNLRRWQERCNGLGLATAPISKRTSWLRSLAINSHSVRPASPSRNWVRRK